MTVDDDRAWADEYAAQQRVIAEAAARVDYRLTFAETEPRECHAFGLSGPPLPNAYKNPGSPPTGSGNWEDPEFFYLWENNGADQQTAIGRWFEGAVREAIHEALEWFRVDGEVHLDPHGEHEQAIHDLSGEFAAALAALVGSKPTLAPDTGWT